MRESFAVASLFVFALLAAPVVAQEDRPNLTGTWQLDATKSELKSIKLNGATWVIQEGDNAIHLTESDDGKGKKLEFQCTTDGKECKGGGDKTKASFWFNGAMLVEMETKGDHVTRYRMSVSSDGKTMTVQSTHIVPQDDRNDTLVFAKLAATSSKL